MTSWFIGNCSQVPTVIIIFTQWQQQQKNPSRQQRETKRAHSTVECSWWTCLLYRRPLWAVVSLLTLHRGRLVVTAVTEVARGTVSRGCGQSVQGTVLTRGAWYRGVRANRAVCTWMTKERVFKKISVYVIYSVFGQSFMLDVISTVGLCPHWYSSFRANGTARTWVTRKWAF